MTVSREIPVGRGVKVVKTVRLDMTGMTRVVDDDLNSRDRGFELVERRVKN